MGNRMDSTGTDNGDGSFDHELAHGGNPVTRWMAANVAVAQDPAGNLKPAEDKSTERIDGIVALIMAIGRALVAHEEQQPVFLAVWV
jgi:phage terminase large subunit-like protein